MFVLYVICGIWYDQLTATESDGKTPINGGVNIRFFQTLYYLSSFFNQFGPNATTWLVAGEWAMSYLGCVCCMTSALENGNLVDSVS